MITLTSISQAQSLKGTIPELAIIRSLQFMGDGYMPGRDGHIIVIQQGDSLAHIFVPLKNAEFIEAFVEDDHIVFEAVVQIDDSMTYAYIIPDGEWLPSAIRTFLHSASPPPLPRLGDVAMGRLENQKPKTVDGDGGKPCSFEEVVFKNGLF